MKMYGIRAFISGTDKLFWEAYTPIFEEFKRAREIVLEVFDDDDLFVGLDIQFATAEVTNE